MNFIIIKIEAKKESEREPKGFKSQTHISNVVPSFVSKLDIMVYKNHMRSSTFKLKLIRSDLYAIGLTLYAS